jgi:hypothetical protein
MATFKLMTGRSSDGMEPSTLVQAGMWQQPKSGQNVEDYAPMLAPALQKANTITYSVRV